MSQKLVDGFAVVIPTALLLAGGLWASEIAAQSALPRHIDTPVSFKIADSSDQDARRRCWVPSNRQEPRDCWSVPGTPALDQRRRIDGDGHLEDCWSHPEETGVDICEDSANVYVV